jgi:hypothetical protein
MPITAFNAEGTERAEGAEKGLEKRKKRVLGLSLHLCDLCVERGFKKV